MPNSREEGPRYDRRPEDGWRIMITKSIEDLERKQNEHAAEMRAMKSTQEKFFDEYGLLLKQMLEQKARRQKFISDAVMRLAVAGVWSCLGVVAAALWHYWRATDRPLP